MRADEGYYFGIGAFETIAVEEGVPVLFGEHLRRLRRAMEFFQIKTPMEEIEGQARQALNTPEMKKGRRVLKIAVSPENILVTSRENTYQKEDYIRGFRADFSPVRRNESSPLTYHKTLNYGDCLLEKRAAKSRGIDEPVFLNMKGEIAEGACTNVFFVKRGRLITPEVSCGLLPGILREYICGSAEVEERSIRPEEIPECEEMFVTNSLLGVMPVISLGEHAFPSRTRGDGLLAQYIQRITASF